MRKSIVYLLVVLLPYTTAEASGWRKQTPQAFRHTCDHWLPSTTTAAVKSSEPEVAASPKLEKKGGFSLFGNRSAAVKSDVESTKPVTPPVPKPPTPLREEPAATEPANPDDELAPPPVVIGAETKYDYGQLVRLSIKPPAKTPANLHSVKYTWVILPNTTHEIWPDASKVIFSSGIKPQTFVVITTAAYVYATPGSDNKLQITQRIAQTTSMVQVGSGALPPVVGGGSTSVGNGGGTNLTGFSKHVYEWTQSIDQSSRYTVAMAKMDAKKVAENFRATRADINENHLTDVASVAAATKALNDRSLNENAKSHWQPWFDQLTEHLKSEFVAGNIQGKAALMKTWGDIAVALDEFSK